MDHADQAQSVRKIVLQTAAGWGVSNDRFRALATSDIVRDGETVGRRYEIDGIRAIWLFDRDVLVFSGRIGQLLKTVSVSGTLSGRARVA